MLGLPIFSGGWISGSSIRTRLDCSASGNTAYGTQTLNSFACNNHNKKGPLKAGPSLCLQVSLYKREQGRRESTGLQSPRLGSGLAQFQYDW